MRENVESLNDRTIKGEIVDTKGKVLGNHDGYPFFTIGQRKKLGIAVGRPIYVVEIDGAVLSGKVVIQK